MAYSVENIFSFFDENDTGLHSVPLNKLIIVKSTGQMFIKKTNDGITQNTTIKQAIAAGSLDAGSVEGGASGTGFDYIQESAPTNAKQGEIWFRPSTFEIFVVESGDSPDNIKWVGSKGTIIEGGQETPPGEANQKPTAPTNTSSFPATVAAGKQVQFIFSGSTDSDGTVQSYEVSGISDAVMTCSSPVVAAGSPHLFTVGSLSGGAKSVTFYVNAIDNQGAKSDKVQVTTNVQDLPIPSAPTNAGEFPAIICAPGKQGSFTFTGSDIGTHYEVYDFSNENLTVQEAKVAAGQPHVFNGVSETIKVTFKVKAISAQGIDSTPVTVTTKVEKTPTQPGSQPETGEVGFGVGLAPEDVCTKYGMTLLSNQPGNENYGNYRHNTSGSIMVWIPKFYFRITEDSSSPYFGTRFDISFEPKSGYVIHRAFIDGGQEVPGFFIDKYHCGAENQVCVSKPNIVPTASGVSSTSNGITNHYSSKGFQNQCGYFLDAVKTRGSEFNLVTVFQLNALAMLGDAYYQECYRTNKTSQIAWADKAPYQPKGNNNALKDYNDTSVTFVQASGAYSGVSLTGSASNLAKTTHNGERCGVADVNGNLYRWCIGIKTAGNTSLQVMKESVFAKDITRANATSASNYDNTTIPFSAGSSLYFGNGTYNPFRMVEDRNSNEYRLNCAGIPSSGSGVSSSGTERFGQDYLSVASSADYFAGCGGNYGGTSYSGVWYRVVGYSLSVSSSSVGFSASLYPH